MPALAGEEIQDIGRDGLREAKNWLERTTRVQSSWTHEDQPMAELLAFKWPYGTTGFTFDLGGRFRGDQLDGQAFMAEVKHYKNESNLPTHYRDFLAKCYVAYQSKPNRCDHFLWISWSPFQAKSWEKHASADKVKSSILHAANVGRVLGEADLSRAEALLDHGVLGAVADRVWLLTLCAKQEQLVLTKEHYVEVVKLITEKAI